ncbi:MAG: UDP-N-acetylmuramate dehydrogenase [Rhodothermaceae bacterium]|nr:UDP-N-acetylmuramate dehydrogenase [Rhodothermaceae bacterium]
MLHTTHTSYSLLEQRVTEQIGAGRLKTNVPLAPFTTFRIGGPADFYIDARSADELAAAILIARSAGIPFFLLGMGANIVIGDRGFRGLIVHNRAQAMSVDLEKKQIFTESGAIVYPNLIDLAVANNLSGLEHYVGIPSTVGGALWQNLHFLSPPPERERTMFIEEVLMEAELLTEEGDRKTVPLDYFDFGYDYSTLHIREDIVLTATFQLEDEKPERMKYIMQENLAWRQKRHPPLDTEPSAGSIFKKIEGIGAGRLIDECGLKGSRIGGIEITHRHANIMINRGGGTAADLKKMIAHVQEVVQRETGYLLETEVKFIGEL